ncbi:MAG TPA: hypothetical protein VFZ66_20540 [Herpetosiphonaceae bacterium]
MNVRTLGLLLGLVIGMLVSAMINRPVEAGTRIDCWTRQDAVDYSYKGRHEGYEWGGGWWNDNDQDDTPGCATDGGSGCEGPDCSGFTFKSWALPNSSGATGYVKWTIGENVHGPYNSTSYRDGCNGACFNVCGNGTSNSCGAGSYDETMRMDAFAQDGHVGLLYNEDSNGYDHIIEAINNSAGTGIWQRNYRVQTAYDGMRRRNWCTP